MLSANLAMLYKDLSSLRLLAIDTFKMQSFIYTGGKRKMIRC